LSLGRGRLESIFIEPSAGHSLSSSSLSLPLASLSLEFKVVERGDKHFLSPIESRERRALLLGASSWREMKPFVSALQLSLGRSWMRDLRKTLI
jgi:hypothetical protein